MVFNQGRLFNNTGGVELSAICQQLGCEELVVVALGTIDPPDILLGEDRVQGDPVTFRLILVHDGQQLLSIALVLKRGKVSAPLLARFLGSGPRRRLIREEELLVGVLRHRRILHYTGTLTNIHRAAGLRAQFKPICGALLQVSHLIAGLKL